MTPGYFSALGIPLASGRNLATGDGLLEPGVLLVNETLARLHFPGEDPVGRATDRGTIVGVVGDVRQAGLNRPVEPEIYKVINRDAGVASDLGMTLVVRTDGPPEDIVPAVRAAVRDVNPVVALFNIKTMAQVVADSLWELNLYRWLIGLFAGAGARARRHRVVRRHLVRRHVADAGVRRAAGARIRSGGRRAARAAQRTPLGDGGLVLGIAAGAGRFAGAAPLSRASSSPMPRPSPPSSRCSCRSRLPPASCPPLARRSRQPGDRLAARLTALHESTLLQPLLESHDPVADRPLVGRAQAEAVSAGAVDVQLGDDAGALEAQIGLGQPFGNVLAVGVGRGQEDGRRFLRRLDVAGSARIDRAPESPASDDSRSIGSAAVGVAAVGLASRPSRPARRRRRSRWRRRGPRRCSTPWRGCGSAESRAGCRRTTRRRSCRSTRPRGRGGA